MSFCQHNCTISMIRQILFAILLLPFTISAQFSEQDANDTCWALAGKSKDVYSRVALYRPGDYSSKNYRIPAIVTASDGSLVAACDKRKYNDRDLPEDIDILYEYIYKLGVYQKMNENSFTANVMPETLRRTSLGNSMGKSVNLERAMSAGGRFGGHIVSGHIDGTGVLESRRNEKNAVWYRIKCPPEIAKYIVQKGSVALDGISLTVAKVSPDNTWFEVSVIPNTESQTNLSGKKAGDMINIETDVIGKYVEKLLKTEEKDNKSTLTMEILKEMQI